MAQDLIAESIEWADEFDISIDQALTEIDQRSFGGLPVSQHHHLRSQRAATLAAKFRDGAIYPIEWTPGVAVRAVDTKLQMYMTGQIVPGLMNSQYHLLADRQSEVSVQLVRRSLDQDLILKSRILWERIMNLVHFIQTGMQDIPKSSSRSTKRKFFDMCDSTGGRWRWMNAYDPIIAVYDERFRTPEVHKRSVLRSYLMRGEEPEDFGTQLLNLLNDAINSVWQNIESIVSGGGVVALSNAHMGRNEDGSIDMSKSGDLFKKWGWNPGDDDVEQ